MSDLLVKLIGWKATILHGDPCVYDRWKWLQRHLTRGALRTLEAGCGSGAFTLYAGIIGNIVVGLSFDQRNNSVATRRAQILQLPNASFKTVDLRQLDQYTNSLGQFDQVLCLEVIEHIKDDQKLAHDLSSLIKPGGKLLLTTPYAHYKKLWGDTLSASEDGGHVRWGYTHDDLARLLEPSGIEVISQEYVSGFVSQQLTNLTRILATIHPYIAWLGVLPLRLLGVFDAPLTRVLKYPYLSVAVVGMKRPR